MKNKVFTVIRSEHSRNGSFVASHSKNRKKLHNLLCLTKNTRLGQGQSNGQILLDIIKSNQRKDNSEHLLGISVRSQANKDRYSGEHCELYNIFTVILCMVSLFLL